MSEHLLRILLTELSTVRLVCKDKSCGAVTEISLEQLRTRFSDVRCPLCKAAFGDSDVGGNPFKDFAQAVRAIQSRSDHVEVEFVLPIQTKE